MNIHKILHHTSLYCTAAIVLLCSACESFLEINPPKSQMSREAVFWNETTAMGALNGLYQTFFSGIASGSSGSVSILAALSADELLYGSETSSAGQYQAINENAIAADNPAISGMWSNAYSIIYSTNAIMEGLAKTTSISKEMTQQISGEALFMRAFTYFYLVNLFGEVPLVTGTDYTINAKLPLSSVDAIYNHIHSDLQQAYDLLTDTYPETNRFRPNRSTVSAMLARLALYRENWESAERYASEVIAQEELYRFAPINEVFLKTGGEALWQRMPGDTYLGAAETGLFISSARPVYMITPQLYASFDINDLRRSIWLLDEREEASGRFVPYKYKAISEMDKEASECSIILRLAELYLIRAEARAHLNKLPTAVADLDVIRERAGLPLFQNLHPDIGQQALLDSILLERQRELFTEWGHRWLDLKRTGRAEAVLSLIKPDFIARDEFYPIPENDELRNPSL